MLTPAIHSEERTLAIDACLFAQPGPNFQQEVATAGRGHEQRL